MRTLLLSLVLCGAALAQSTATCNLSLTATTAATTTWFDNRATLCRTFAVTYQASGFSALSFALEGAPCAATSCNAQGTAVSIPSPIQGSNPSTDTGQATIATNLYYPWIRLNLSTVTGTGTFSATALGYPGLSARTQTIPFSLTPASSPTIGYLSVVKLVPVNPTVTVTCGSGCTQTWRYRVVACLGNGACEPGPANVSVINSVILGATSFNTISSPVQPYATVCYLYRTRVPGGSGLTTGLIANIACTGATVVDNGLLADGSAIPVSSTGEISAVSYAGHIVYRATGPAPSIATPGDCGTDDTSNITGSDVIGNVLIGGTGTTTCKVTFGTVWTGAVTCLVNLSSGVTQAFVNDTSTDHFTIAGNASLDNTTVSWVCLGAR